MNKMGDKHRYHPYYRTKNYNDNFKQSYRHYSSSHHNERLNNQNQTDFSNHQSKSKNYSYVPTQQPVPLMSTVIPQERESWIRSVKKTKINESTEQKTQYLETILRMPQQQKSSMNSSTFDRIRFAVDQTSTMMNTIENNNLNENSYHLIGDINNHDEICAIEKLLFNHELQSNTGQCSNQIINCEPNLQTNAETSAWSGFLIDNCDEEVLPPVSPPRLPSLSSTIEESIQQNQDALNEQCVILVKELDAADAEQRQELNRQKRLQKKLQKKKKLPKTKVQQQINKTNSISTVNNKDHQELSSDWIIEYDLTETDHISKLTDMVEKTSTTMIDEDKIDKINLVLKKIKKQQKDLRILRKYVMSILNEEQNIDSTDNTRQNSDTNHDLLMKFLNQPTTSGCWLCSGKTYTEVATQFNNLNK